MILAMNSTSDIVYISIESRKGGVGKTTVALTLAELFLQKGYQVLLVDMDIIGTRIDKTFIEGHQNLLHEVSYEGAPVNLLKLFNEVYISGKNVPAFMPDNEKQSNYLTFERGKCNIIGSDLYSKKEDGEDMKEEEEKNTILEDPRVLYDAFHAYWMIEFVKEIVMSFERAMNRGDKIVVVFDNSPGFSSIENGIHDFLTDIGTEKGKFVLVSSIDQQDIDACRQTKVIINTIIKDKLEASEYYRSLKADENKEEKNHTSSAFNSVWNSLCVSNGQLPEYYSINHEVEVKKFIGIIVNKVPRNIVEDVEKKILNKNDEEFIAPFLNHLLYNYNKQLLDKHEITHHINFNSGFDDFKLSGDIAKIEEDDIRYLHCIDYLKQIGLNKLFKPEWSPLALFDAIKNYLKEQEALKDVSEFSVSKIYGTAQREKGFERNVETVKEFVLKNLKEGVDLHNVFIDVIDFVKNQITLADSRNAPLALYPDTPKLGLIGGFVSDVGLAIYRLNKYDVICELLNELITHSLEDVETLEQLDTDAICGMIDDILNGRENVEDIKDTVSAMINKTIIARELRYAINQIIKQWEL